MKNKHSGKDLNDEPFSIFSRHVSNKSRAKKHFIFRGLPLATPVLLCNCVSYIYFPSKSSQ